MSDSGRISRAKQPLPVEPQPTPLPPELPVVTEWPNLPRLDSSEDRPADYRRVAFFEGLSLSDFRAHLPIHPRREQVLETIGSIISDGNPDRVDRGMEAFVIADMFSTSEPYNDPELAPFPITGRDRGAYCDLFMFGTRQGLSRLHFWERHPGQILAHYGFGAMQHPMARLIDALPVTYRDQLRSLPVFNRLAGLLIRDLPTLQTSRSLTVLYPGSGSHIAP